MEISKNVLARHYSLFLILVLTTSLFSCGEGEKESFDGNIYKVEISFNGLFIENYFKQVSFSGYASQGGNMDIKDSSGKVLHSNHITDQNYTFSSNNTFTTVPANYFYLSVLVGNINSDVTLYPVTIKIIVYKDKEVVLDIEETATPEKQFSLSKSF